MPPNSPPTLTLFRASASREGTFGTLIDSKMEHQCFIGELPWENNQRNVSRIPAGTYSVVPHKSPRFGHCFAVEHVTGRSHILIHAGNFCGSKEHGLKSDVEGCLLPGVTLGHLDGQQVVLSSKMALVNLLDDFPRGFVLRIIDGA